MYVVKYKERIVLGIIPWNNQYIMDVMRNRYNSIIELPYLEPELAQFPYVVNEDITIYPANENRDPNIDPMIQYYFGPSWEFLTDRIVAHYEILPLTLEAAKNNYRDRAANFRYEKEISGTKITINGNTYNLETNRESRSKYVEKFILLNDEQTINWKFTEGWTTLTKQNIQSIIHSIDEHIQKAFDWELSMNNLINSVTNSNDLLNIEELKSLNKEKIQKNDI